MNTSTMYSPWSSNMFQGLFLWALKYGHIVWSFNLSNSVQCICTTCECIRNFTWLLVSKHMIVTSVIMLKTCLWGTFHGTIYNALLYWKLAWFTYKVHCDEYCKAYQEWQSVKCHIGLILETQLTNFNFIWQYVSC